MDERDRAGEFGFVLASSDRFRKGFEQSASAASFAQEFREHVGATPLKRRKQRRIHPPNRRMLSSEFRLRGKGSRVAGLAEAERKLKQDARIFLCRRCEKGDIEKSGIASARKTPVRELQRMNAYGSSFVRDERSKVFPAQCPKRFQRVQGDDQRRGRRTGLAGEELAKVRNGCHVASLDEQTLGGFPAPKRRTGTGFYQLANIQSAHVRCVPGGRSAMREPIDAAPVMSGVEPILLLKMPWVGGVIPLGSIKQTSDFSA